MAMQKTAAQTMYMPPSATRYAFMLTLAIALCMLLPEHAYATASPMGYVLCGVVDMVYGNLGRGIATLAVMALGVGAMLGKVSWGLALTVSTGMALIFGAAGLVTEFSLLAGVGNAASC
jgi:type IV secretory pathway VirB2 component (pilin)